MSEEYNLSEIKIKMGRGKKKTPRFKDKVSYTGVL